MHDQQQDIISAVLSEVRKLIGGVIISAEVERELEGALRLQWGGQKAYVKKADVDLAARNHAIRMRYNMTNRHELMAEFGISRGAFYKILRAGCAPECTLCLERRQRAG